VLGPTALFAARTGVLRAVLGVCGHRRRLLTRRKGQAPGGSCPAVRRDVSSSPPRCGCGWCVGVVGCSGGVLLSHDPSVAVPSALEGLASGFGMGPGVSPPLCPPEHRTTPTRPTHTRVWPPRVPVNGCGGGVVVGICTVDASSAYLFLYEAVFPTAREVFLVVLGVCGASPRPISTGRLHTLRCFHLRPINPLVWWGP
jgi:hypothetical protein